MKQRILTVFLIFILFKLIAQELELSASHEEILKNILKMNITVRIYKNQQTVLWNMAQSKLTIPGKAVTLKLESKDLRVYGIFTPYQVNENLVLLAQSQVVMLPSATRGLRYYTSVKTLVITLNESIFFYPLGKTDVLSGSQGGDNGDIEIELQLVPYQLSNSEKAGAEDKSTSKKEKVIP